MRLPVARLGAAAMAAADILAFAVQALEALPGLISAGSNIVSFVQKVTGQVQDMQKTDRAPTQQEWDELNQQIAVLRQRLHSP